ncbi:MAG TPA: hypothetical protein VHC22_27320 [Pirellulales bacterium]|nr:hypothetical protein [Pirellulales bacterium]
MNGPPLLIAAMLFLLSVHSTSGAELPESGNKTTWESRYRQAADEYALYRDSNKLELQPEPVYRWSHAVREGGTGGSIYVWTHEGCAEAVACFWRMRYADGHATLGHELHSLSPGVLGVVREGADVWKPTAAFERTAFDDAPDPAPKPAARLAQMRSLARDFAGHSSNPGGKRWELRTLTTPVYRNQSSDPDVVDGALFAMVCTVGTDPEAFLLLEARRTAGRPRWHFGVARFSHLDLFVNYREREVWRAVRGPDDTFRQNPTQTYRSFHVPVDESADEATGQSTQ